jgi:hypothetical protein
VNTDREAEALLRRRLEALLTVAPPPSAALAEVLRTGITPEAVSLPRVRSRRRWLVAAPLTVALLGGTVGAASANVLPDAVQGVVADTVGTLTPLDLPKPGHQPHPAKPQLPAPAQLAPRATPHATLPTQAAQPIAPPSTTDGRPGLHRGESTHPPVPHPVDQNGVVEHPTPRPTDLPAGGDHATR